MNTFVEKFNQMGPVKFCEYLALSCDKSFRLTAPRIVALRPGHVEYHLSLDAQVDRAVGLSKATLCTAADQAAELVLLASQEGNKAAVVQGMAIEYIEAAPGELFVTARLDHGRAGGETESVIAIEMKNVAGAAVCRATLPVHL